MNASDRRADRIEAVGKNLMIRARVLSLISAVVSLGFGALILAAPAGAQTSWVGTRTHAHPTGSATFVEYLPDTEVINLVVALKLRNPDQFNQQLESVTTRGNPQ